MKIRFFFALFLILPVLTVSPQKAEKKTPRYDEALGLFAAGKYEASLNVIRQVLTNTFRPYEMRMLAAANYSRLGKNQNAMDHLLFCVRENPKRPEPRIFLAGMFRREGEYKKALEYAARSLRETGENAGLRLEIARSYYKLKEYDHSRRHLDKIYTYEKNNPDAIFLDGLIFLRLNRFDNAEFRFRQALDLHPADPLLLANIYNNLGFSLESQGDLARNEGDEKKMNNRYRQAERMYRFALQTVENHAEARKNMERLSEKIKS